MTRREVTRAAVAFAAMALLSACIEAKSHEVGDGRGDAGILAGDAGAGGALSRPGAGGSLGSGGATAGAGGAPGPDAGAGGALGAGGAPADGGAADDADQPVPWCLLPAPASRPPSCGDIDQPYSQQLTVTSMCTVSRTVDPFGSLRCAFCADSRGHFLDGCTTGANLTCYPYVDPVLGGHETCCEKPSTFCVADCTECAQ